MAVIDNRVTEEGDILIIKPEVPIVGIMALYQFVDTTENESETNYFLKEFRYSVDGGLTFSDWVKLSLINISAIQITQQSAFVIEYRYTRIGNAPEVKLAFEDILVSGEIEDLPYPIYQKTVFDKFFPVNDINIFGWAINVLEKLYVKGLILPDYIERANNNSNLEDEDFIVYWNSVTHYFAIIVYFARQFHNFDTNQYLLEAFLQSRDITTPIDKNIADLVYLYSNLIEEYKKRGTFQVIDRGEVDGELLRLIGNNINDEFIFATLQNFETGWCLGKSSPTWKGTENILNLIKFNSVVAESEVGTIDKIVISSKQSYEVSFKVKTSNLLARFTLGAKTWDKDNNALSLRNNYNDADSDYFIQAYELLFADTWCNVKGVIYPFTSDATESLSLNIGQGNNLRFREAANKVVPFLTITGVQPEEIEIEGVILRPVKLPFSRGQLGIKNIIYLNSINNNGSLSDKQIQQFISEKLISYDNVLKVNFI